jgi:hypothetical protein
VILVRRTTRLRLTHPHTLLVTAALGHGAQARTAWDAWRDLIDVDTLDQASLEMLPLLTSNLARVGAEQATSQRLVGITRQSWFRNQLLVDAAADAAGRLEEAGIETMATGGLAAAVVLYPDIGLRTFGRADLAVRAVPPARAAAHLVAAGWSAGGLAGDAAILTDRRGLQVALGPSALTDHGGAAADLLWAGRHTVTVAERRLPVPSLTDTLLMALLEGLRHGRPVELRWIGDAAVALQTHGDRIEWDRLVGLSRRLERGRRVGAGLTSLVAMLDVTIPPRILDALSGETTGRRERIEHRLWLQGSPGSRTSALIRHWFRYRRFLPETGNLLGFGRYLRRRIQARSRP